MTSTRVRGELGPACGTCQATKRWSGTRWFCHPCRAAKQRDWRMKLSPDRLEAERVRGNELRNARRAAASPEERQREYDRTQAWRVANRGKYLQGSRDWYSANADQARAAKLDNYRTDKSTFLARNLLRKARQRVAICEHGDSCVSPEFLAEQIYSQVCIYCGDAATDADHFTPLSKGGLHCRANLVPACDPCNSSKHARDPIEFIVGVRGDQ